MLSKSSTSNKQATDLALKVAPNLRATNTSGPADDIISQTNREIKRSLQQSIYYDEKDENESSDGHNSG